MSHKAANKRLVNVAEAIDRRPLDKTQVCAAYERFRETGELPEQLRLAKEVVERALNGGAVVPPITSEEGRLARLLQILATAQKRIAQNLPADGGRAPRDQLFLEAVHTFEPARMAARIVIKSLVSMGRDVADPEFMSSDVELPDFGSVGLHMLGWPDQWVKPPFEPQMQRVMQQHTLLRAHTVRTEAWYREAAAGRAAFLREGKVPADEAVQLFALTTGEMFAIQWHYFGRGGEDLLAAYETVATSTGAERAAALEHLGKLQARATEARE